MTDLHSTPKQMTRRQFGRLLGGAALAAAGVAAIAPGTARAGRAWCRVDPSFLVDGLIGNVYVAGELNRAYDVTGPIHLRFAVPEGTDVQLLASDLGFGQGYDIEHIFTPKLKNDHKKIDIEISVFVPAASDDLPVLVEFVPDGTIEVEDHKDGRTNKWIKVKTQLKKPKRAKDDKDDKDDDTADE